MNLSLNNPLGLNKLTSAIEENMRNVLPTNVGTLVIDETIINDQFLQLMKVELENCTEEFIFRENECLAITTYKNTEAFNKDVNSVKMAHFLSIGIAKVHAESLRVGVLVREADGRKLKELCARARAA